MKLCWVPAVALVMFAGCGPPAPMPTDGPNQVVFYVPTMT